ncbi:MAG: ATP-binding cassette domain-containing protein [Proteobacteria bacterium]|nr:ATP-binding cassette domain-containing protein [Pseudomonadota bacterium]
MLELRDVETFYGNIMALKGISLSVSEGEIITLIGANGAGKSTTLMTICGIVPARHRRYGHLPGPRRPPDLSNAYGRRKSQYRGLCPEGQGRNRPGHGICLFTLSDPEKTPPSAGGNAQRRRTADAGHLPRPDGPAAPPAFGRAFARTRPALRAADLPDDPEDQRGEPDDDPAGGTEREHGPPGRPSRICHGERPDHPAGDRREPPRQ